MLWGYIRWCFVQNLFPAWQHDSTLWLFSFYIHDISFFTSYRTGADCASVPPQSHEGTRIFQKTSSDPTCSWHLWDDTSLRIVSHESIESDGSKLVFFLGVLQIQSLSMERFKGAIEKSWWMNSKSVSVLYSDKNTLVIPIDAVRIRLVCCYHCYPTSGSSMCKIWDVFSMCTAFEPCDAALSLSLSLSEISTAGHINQVKQQRVRSHVS